MPGAGGYPGAPGTSMSATVPAKAPGVLNAAVWLSVVTGVLGILAGVVDIVGGKHSIQAALTKAATDLGVDPSLAQQVGGDELKKAYQTLVIKAVVSIVVAAAVLALAFAARNAAMWARITLTVALVVAMCAGSGLQLGDRSVLPSLSVIASALAPLLSLVAIVLLFLPPVNRYAAARRNA
jgi:hypothetical protein